MLDAPEIIRLFDLKPHPENGYYRETFRDVPGPDGRAASTLIYFLLQAGQISAWHRVDATEAWHYYAGAPLRLSFWQSGRSLESVELGADFRAGQRPQCVVPAGFWQMAEAPAGCGWTLVGCSVAPGFEFSGFEMAEAGWQPDIGG
ncbi:MAG TPA: cupin domain-containing protein [Methylovirgula sp.]